MIKKPSVLMQVLKNYWWLFVVLAVIVTYVLIMVLAQGQSVWYDEGYSIMIAKQSVSRLLALTAVDAHPPVYYLLLKAWGSIFNWNECALRSLSAIVTSLTVGSMLVLIRRLFTKKVALVAIPFLVLSPFLLRYGYEIRMYALAGLIGVLATMVLVKAVSSNRKLWWIVYALFVALGMYTLYMTVVIWLAHLVWLLVQSVRQKQRIVKQPWLKSYIGAFILFIPYISTFIYQMTHSALPGIGSALTINELGGVLGFMMSYVPSWQVGGVLSVALLIFLGLGIYLASFIVKKVAAVQRQWLLLILLCFFVPLIFYMLVSLLPNPFFIPRYIAHIVIFFYALIGIVVALGWRYGKRVSVVLFGGIALILLIVGVFQLHTTGNFNFERLQMPSANLIRTKVTCNESTVIVADDPYIYIENSYYYDGCNLRFYSIYNVPFEGGYAPLNDSILRVASPASIHAQTLYTLHWTGGTPNFVPTSNYILVSSTTFSQEVVNHYELKP